MRYVGCNIYQNDSRKAVVRYFPSIPHSKSSLNNQIFTFEITLHPLTCLFIVNPSFKNHASHSVWCHVTTPIFQNHMHDAVYFPSILEATQHPTRPSSFLSAKISVLYGICSNNHSLSSIQANLLVVNFTSILEILLWTIICQRFAFRLTHMIFLIFPVSKIVTTTTVIVMMMVMMMVIIIIIIIIIILSESS